MVKVLIAAVGTVGLLSARGSRAGLDDAQALIQVGAVLGREAPTKGPDDATLDRFLVKSMVEAKSNGQNFTDAVIRNVINVTAPIALGIHEVGKKALEGTKKWGEKLMHDSKRLGKEVKLASEKPSAVNLMAKTVFSQVLKGDRADPKDLWNGAWDAAGLAMKEAGESANDPEAKNKAFHGFVDAVEKDGRKHNGLKYVLTLMGGKNLTSPEVEAAMEQDKARIQQSQSYQTAKNISAILKKVVGMTPDQVKEQTKVVQGKQVPQQQQQQQQPQPQPQPQTQTQTQSQQQLQPRLQPQLQPQGPWGAQPTQPTMQWQQMPPMQGMPPMQQMPFMQQMAPMQQMPPMQQMAPMQQAPFAQQMMSPVQFMSR